MSVEQDLKSIITVRYDEISATMDRREVIPWLFGFNELLPGAISMRTVSEREHGVLSKSCITILTNMDNRGERYSITIGDAAGELPASWVIPWASGFAAHRGVDLSGILDPNSHRRNHRMQALMICHRNMWLEYNGMTEREKS